MFCKHEWQEERLWVPPVSGVTQLDNVSTYSAKQILFGFTSIYRTCKKCGKDASTTVLGDFSNG